VENADIRTLAAANYNECWRLLELPERSEDDDVELLTSAFASRRLWREVGGTEQAIVAEWMVSRALSATGHGALAVTFARRAVSASQDPSSADWLVASCVEGLARAQFAAGDVSEARASRARAAVLVAAIVDPEDRDIIAEQLAQLDD
jgi:hypothetical protein